MNHTMAYVEMTDSQLAEYQDFFDQALTQLEEMGRDLTPREEELYPQLQEDALEIEREQASRWRAAFDMRPGS